MKTWRQALFDGVISGSTSSVLSTATLSACGVQETGTPYAPTNATSHWLFGDRAASHDGPSVRYTGTGYMIHHASSTLWAVIYEKWFGLQTDQGHMFEAVAGAASVAAIACFVDYRLTPRRLTPGFEKRLSKSSLFWVYASFGAGLTARGLVEAAIRHKRKGLKTDFM